GRDGGKRRPRKHTASMRLVPVPFRNTTESGLTAKIIDGKAVGEKIREECRQRVQDLQSHGVTPGLAVILVGANPASMVYVRNKIRACADVGIRSLQFEYKEDVDPSVVIERIEALNADPEVHGILVQLPLPPQFEIHKVLHAISPDKDVDGFHLYNVGGLVLGNTVFPPCPPYGVL